MRLGFIGDEHDHLVEQQFAPAFYGYAVGVPLRSKLVKLFFDL